MKKPSYAASSAEATDAEESFGGRIPPTLKLRRAKVGRAGFEPATSCLSKKIKESATLMDVQLLDHLIIIPEGRYYSMADEKML